MPWNGCVCSPNHREGGGHHECEYSMPLHAFSSEVCHVHDVEAVVTLLTESVKWLTEKDKISFVPGIDR